MRDWLLPSCNCWESSKLLPKSNHFSAEAPSTADRLWLLRTKNYVSSWRPTTISEQTQPCLLTSCDWWEVTIIEIPAEIYTLLSKRALDCWRTMTVEKSEIYECLKKYNHVWPDAPLTADDLWLLRIMELLKNTCKHFWTEASWTAD